MSAVGEGQSKLNARCVGDWTRTGPDVHRAVAGIALDHFLDQEFGLAFGFDVARGDDRPVAVFCGDVDEGAGSFRLDGRF